LTLTYCLYRRADFGGGARPQDMNLHTKSFGGRKQALCVDFEVRTDQGLLRYLLR
jgi:hypothetical protein